MNRIIQLLFLLFSFVQFDVLFVRSQMRDLVVQETNHLLKLIPLKNESYIMFWRPQKVGSSTILSFLISYAYRYNLQSKRRGYANSFCTKMKVCLHHSNAYKKDSHLRQENIDALENRLVNDFKEIQSEKLMYSVSWSHQLCNLPAYLVTASLPCAFSKDFNYLNEKYLSNTKSNEYKRLNIEPPNKNNMREIFVVRDPLSRMISVYYFWGELFRLKQTISSPLIPRMVSSISKAVDRHMTGKDKEIVRIGAKVEKAEVIRGNFFSKIRHLHLSIH